MTRILLSVAAFLLCGIASHAHVENILSLGPPLVTVGWPTGASITYVQNNQTGPGLPNMEAGSAPVAAVDGALATVAGASGLTFVNGGTSAITDGGSDGVNLVTFASTANNIAVTTNATAVNLAFFNPATGVISESDIVFNPTSQFSTLGTAGFSDVESVAVHEGGHGVGLLHSPLVHATMFPFFASGRTSGRTLSLDDIGGLRTLYPTAPGAPVGIVSGSIQRAGGVPVFGAHVVLQDHATGLAVVGTLSRPDGSFTLTGVPRGVYRLYAEPLDLPFQPASVTSGIWGSSGPMDTTFRTAYKGGTANPRLIAIKTGNFVSVGTLFVSGPAPTVNLQQVGLCTTSPGGGFSCSGISAAANQVVPPYTDAILIAGPGLHTLPDAGFGIDGPFASITGPSLSAPGVVDAKIFPVSVVAEAPPGGYVIRYEDPVTGELSLLSGTLGVEPGATIQPYVAPYLDPCLGSAGPVVLSSSQPPALGNMNFDLTVSGTIPGETAFYFLAFAPDVFVLPVPGCVLGVDLVSLLVPFLAAPSMTATGPTTTLVQQIPNIPFLAGRNIYAQVVTTDPIGFGLSNALLIHIE